MRKTKQCPKCDCKKVLRIDMVAEGGDAGSAGTQARLAIRCEGFSMMGNEKRRTVGQIEAVMCSDCGYVEYYCANPKDVQPDGKWIHELT